MCWHLRLREELRLLHCLPPAIVGFPTSEACYAQSQNAPRPGVQAQETPQDGPGGHDERWSAAKALVSRSDTSHGLRMLGLDMLECDGTRDTAFYTDSASSPKISCPLDATGSRRGSMRSGATSAAARLAVLPGLVLFVVP